MLLSLETLGTRLSAPSLKPRTIPSINICLKNEHMHMTPRATVLTHAPVCVNILISDLLVYTWLRSAFANPIHMGSGSIISFAFL